MVVKLIGSAIVFGACTMIGFIFANQKGQRVRELKFIICALNILAIEIKFAVNMLPDIMIKISSNLDNVIGELFRYAGNLMKTQNITAKESFEKSVEYICPKFNINKQDKEILLQLGNSLGEVDIESQLKSINMVLEQLNVQVEQAETDRLKNEKLYKSLGMIIGLAIVIILL